MKVKGGVRKVNEVGSKMDQKIGANIVSDDKLTGSLDYNQSD